MIRPVRVKKEKKKRSKVRIGLAAVIIILLMGCSAYLVYSYMYLFPGEQESKEQAAIEFNKTLIKQGRIDAYNLILNDSLNCFPIVIPFTNDATNQNSSVTLLPFHCFSDESRKYILENEIKNVPQ